VAQIPLNPKFEIVGMSERATRIAN